MEKQVSEARKKGIVLICFDLLGAFHGRMADMKVAESQAPFILFSKSHKKCSTWVFEMHVFATWRCSLGHNEKGIKREFHEI